MPGGITAEAQTAALELAVALAAIIFLVVLAMAIRLGGDPRIRSEDEARRLAETSLAGFHPVEVGLDRAGIGALLRDGQGRIMLIRRHGVHFVARLLDGHAGSRLNQNFLIVASGERRFGSITLDLGAQAQVWVSHLRRLGA